MKVIVLVGKWNNQHDTSEGQKKIWVPDKNRTYDLPDTGRALYPLSYENSWRARPLNWVHMWHASCILLGSAMSLLIISSFTIGHFRIVFCLYPATTWTLKTSRSLVLKPITTITTISRSMAFYFGPKRRKRPYHNPRSLQRHRASMNT